jgi:HD-GYP domain-containing protein (c-di-GMP phosphodiesterase class II)
MIKKNPRMETRKYRLILSAVHMVYRLVNSTFNVKELSLRLTRLLCQFIKASSASVYLLDPVKKRVVMIAIFDNKINILLDKKKDFIDLPKKELSVTRGMSIFEKHMIGLPLVADDNCGAIFIFRKGSEPAFTEFDREMLAVFGEQAVTAIRNLQLYEEQQKTMLGSIHFVGNMLLRHPYYGTMNRPVYFKIIQALAERLHVGQEGIRRLEYASILHDTGIIDVPFEILSKTGQLTPEEFKIIREIPNKSAALIKPVEFLRPILPIILYHREKYDGTGYPSGLKKEQIPLGARIMAVVDAFEAMVSERPYRRKISVEAAIEEIVKNSGTQFDPKIVEVFVALSNERKFRKLLSLIAR